MTRKAAPAVFFVVLLALAGCSKPAPDSDAIARAVQATLAAVGPRVTETPVSVTASTTPVSVNTTAAAATQRPLPTATYTDTPAPTPTNTQEPTGTPTPTLTPAPTPLVVMIPENWREYRDPTGAFTLLHPPEWEVSAQNVAKVVFGFKPYGVASVELVEMEESVPAKIGDPDALDAMAQYAIEDQEGKYVVKNVEKGVWPYQPTGHFALLDLLTSDGVAEQKVYVASPLGGPYVVMATLVQIAGKVTDANKEALSRVIGSVRPKAWDEIPGPIVVVRPTPMSISTPQVLSESIVNFRAGPGTIYPKVGATKPGEAYDIIGRNKDSSWFQVCCVNEKPVWVAASVVKVQGDSKTVTLAKSIPPTPVPPPSSTPGAEPSVAGSTGWVTKKLAECGTTYSYPPSWKVQAEHAYLDDANRGVIYVICAEAPNGDPMTSRSAALTFAESFGAQGGWSHIVGEEFFNGQGVKFPFRVATFSMQLRDGDAAELLLATVQVGPQHILTVVGMATPSFSTALASDLIHFVMAIGGS